MKLRLLPSEFFFGGEVAHSTKAYYEIKIMNKYINRNKRNETEQKVQEWFIKQGYKSLSRGWPDFVFFKYKPHKKVEAIFVEVKRANQSSIKPHQNTMKKILERLGLEVKVCFGAKEDGSPNFQEIRNRRIIKEEIDYSKLGPGVIDLRK